MDLQPTSVPMVPHERALRLIKKVKTPKIEIKLVNPACHFEDEIDENVTPVATPAPPQASKKATINPPSVTPVKRPKLPPPSTHKQKEQSHRKIVDPAEVKKSRQHISPKKSPREYVNIAKPVNIFPPSSSAAQPPSIGNNNNNNALLAEDVTVASVIISELPMRTVTLNSNISPMSSGKKALAPKKSGFVNQFLALKDKSEFINQNYGGGKAMTGTSSPPSPSSPRSPKDPHRGIPAVDVSNLQKLEALTFGVKVEDYPALSKAIREVSPKKPPSAISHKPTAAHVAMVMDDSGIISSGAEGGQREGHEGSALLQQGSVSNVIYIPSPNRAAGGAVVDSDSVFNTGLHSPAVLEPPVIDLDNELNMSPLGVMNGPAADEANDAADDADEADNIEEAGSVAGSVGHEEGGEAVQQKAGEDDDALDAASEHGSDIAEEIDEAIEENLEASTS